jgi:hypothetical protein
MVSSSDLMARIPTGTLLFTMWNVDAGIRSSRLQSYRSGASYEQLTVTKKWPKVEKSKTLASTVLKAIIAFVDSRKVNNLELSWQLPSDDKHCSVDINDGFASFCYLLVL